MKLYRARKSSNTHWLRVGPWWAVRVGSLVLTNFDIEFHRRLLWALRSVLTGGPLEPST